MKRSYLIVVALLFAPALVMALVAQSSKVAPGGVEAAANQDKIQNYLNLVSRSPSAPEKALVAIEKEWHPGSPVMLIEAARFVGSPLVAHNIFELLKRKTGQDFGKDHKAWYRWIWQQKYEPHPQYAQFKSAIYSPIDKRFTEYFQKTDNAKIRLDEIRWGGVRRDGIPPLKNPEMISVAQASYLADTDVVFGIEINGDARCYPKRILAWHEMFKDNIGEVSVCGAY